ncbi:phage major capsid protein [Frankia sp. AiPs1]|uniref:phage major capsid protein n=1 Tax=Frankia sp. AiPs1 TaxID=573493 RepID=UPI002043DDE6|nr:phage major capsid protein [Frankia sp. AiPs1]MCM3920732.1 phage major capsid protein [Frankia sp. AiPs1]
MSYIPSRTALETRNRIGEISEAMQALHDEATDQALDERQQQVWEALDAELDFRDRELSSFERSENLTRSRAAHPGVIKMGTTDSLNDIDLRHASRQTVRDGVLRVLDSRDARHLDGDARGHVERLVESRTDDIDGDRLGRHILASSRPEYLSAFMRAAADPAAPAFTAAEAAAIREVRALAIGGPGTGGYAVPGIIDPTIVLTAQGSPNSIYNLARVETITTDRWTGLSSAGMSWQFHAEAAEATDNSPTIAQPEIIARRADGFIPFSVEVEMDWVNFARSMGELVSEGYNELLAQKLTVGTNGSGEPDGLIAQLVASTSPAPLVVPTAGTLGANSVYSLWKALPARFRAAPGCAFMASTDVENTIRQLGTTDPNFTVDLTQGGIPTLFSRAFSENEYMPDLPTGTNAGAILAVGDFKGYLVAQRAGMQIEAVPHLFGSNRRPTGQRGLFAWSRVGAGVINANAFRVLVNKTS